MTVRPEVRATVIRRDRRCLAALLDRSHRCADRWGTEHPPTDMGKLTIEHVRTDPGGMRRDDAAHLVALCFAANLAHWGASTENRRLLNAYLAGWTAA